MYLLGASLTALAILYLLTTLVLTIAGRVRHPVPIVASLAAVLLVGVILMAE
jgi:hypothetical protein